MSHKDIGNHHTTIPKSDGNSLLVPTNVVIGVIEVYVYVVQSCNYMQVIT